MVFLLRVNPSRRVVVEPDLFRHDQQDVLEIVPVVGVADLRRIAPTVVVERFLGQPAHDEGAQFRGKSAAHRCYFYGVRVQVMTTEQGVPVEFAFLPGAASDVRGLGLLPLALPAGSELFMDSGYTDYAAEDIARELDSVTFRVQRRRDSRRWDEPPTRYYKQLMRKRIETAFSRITAMFPRHIHATSFRGFLLKVSMFIIAFAIDKAFI